MDNKKVLVVKPILENKDIKLNFSTDSFVDYIDMRAFVDGPIELLAIPIVIEGVYYDVFLNEEGKFIEELLPSIILLNNGKIYDVVMGNFFVSKSNCEGESVDLSYDEINKIKKYIINNIFSLEYEINDEILTCSLLRLSY